MNRGHRRPESRYSFWVTRLLRFAVTVSAAGMVSCSMSQKPAPPPSHRLDVHSFAQPHLVAVKHVELDLTVDFDRKVMHGWAELAVVRHDTSAPLIVDTRDLKIGLVETAPGRRASW